MTVIEGIGDEVVQFFSVLFVVGLAVAAWWSTSVRESHGRNIRTVLILERRSRGRTGTELRAPSPAAEDADSVVDTGQRITTDADDGVETEILTDDSQDKDEAEATNGDSEAAESTEERESTSGSAERPLRKRIGPFLKAQAATLLSEPAPDASVDEATQASQQESDRIRVRLKYLNEEQKLVQGRLQEQLGEFKRRNFTVELAADKLVRLIFNGQVLGSDARTLQAYGLYDNCVVHCLVHAHRQPPPRHPPAHPAAAALPPPLPPHHPDWNLSAVLYSFLSVVVCVAWYCRYQYAHMFTLTTTGAMVGLTGMFAVAVFSLYLPDQDGIPN